MQNQPPKNLACHCQGPLEDMQQDSQDAWIAFTFTVQRGKTYCAISAIQLQVSDISASRAEGAWKENPWCKCP
jgi:hypothetical protein